VDTVREYSFLRNPRTPPAVLASRDARPVGGGEGAVAALRGVTAKVLNVTDLAAVDTLPLLSAEERAAVQKKFARATGSWCCAPMAEQKAGAPKSAHFQLMKP
jgi:hypothetical protein